MSPTLSLRRFSPVLRAVWTRRWRLELILHERDVESWATARSRDRWMERRYTNARKRVVAIA